jgi:subtilase family serine protease
MFRTVKLPRNRTRDRSSRHRFRARLRLEELESRTLLSVYFPAQISHAYGVDSITFNNGATAGDGSGQTIAVVVAYHSSTIASDLHQFDLQFNLPDPNFTQFNLGSATSKDWSLEAALDVEWAHALAPKANLVLVEAASDTVDPVTGAPTDLLNAVQTAAAIPGVSVVSMSWGVNEFPTETSWDSLFTTPGVSFVASSGDWGAGTAWPAVSPNVLSVGGTRLELTPSNTIASETGWGHGSLSWLQGGSGGGFSQYEKLPSYQQNITTTENGFALTQLNARLTPDVAFVGDPKTGVAVLDTAAGGWFAVGGTSAGAPQWAALIAIADQGRALDGQPLLSSAETLNALYGLQVSKPGDFHEIMKGSTGVYEVLDSDGNPLGTIPVTAGPGYNLVTGLGTPAANVLIPDLAQAATSSETQVAAAPVARLASSTSSGTGKKAQPSDLIAAQISLALTNVAGAQLSPLPVTPSGFGATQAFAAPPAVMPSLVTLPYSSAGRLSFVVSKGGGAIEPTIPDDAPADDQATLSATPAGLAVLPTAPPALEATQDPMPQKTDPAPDVRQALDAVFMQPESLPGLAPEPMVAELPSAEDRPGFRAAALFGLTVALGLHWRGQPSRRTASERARPRVE